MEVRPNAFQCPYCDFELVVTNPTNGSVTGPCPVCANVITFDPTASQRSFSEPPQANLEPEIEAPILLNPPRRQFRRGRLAGGRRSSSSKSWFKPEIDTPVSPNGVPLVIKRRKKTAFVQPDRLAERLERLSQSPQ